MVGDILGHANQAQAFGEVGEALVFATFDFSL